MNMEKNQSLEMLANLSVIANQNESTAIKYNGEYFVLKNPGTYITYFVLSTMGIFIGTIGNMFIILTIALNKKLRTNPAYMLMMNLSFSDLLISTFVHTFTDIGIFMGTDFYAGRMGFCEFLGALCLVACGTSLINMGSLAVNRYINICHNKSYKDLFTFKRTIGLCIFAWIAGLLVDLPNFLGWGGHFFDPKSANCMWNRLASKSYSIFFPTTAIFLPCAAILFCYVRIFVFAYMAKSKAFAKKDSIASSSSASSSNRELMQSLKIARTLFATFLLFSVSWVPYGVVIVIGFDDRLSMSIHAFVTLMAHINSALNPVLYCTINPVFKNNLKAICLAAIGQKNLSTSSSSMENSMSAKAQMHPTIIA